jgi:hypothetical protein
MYVSRAKISTGRQPVGANNRGSANGPFPSRARCRRQAAAVRAQDALIAEAQRLLSDIVRPGGLSRDALVDALRKLFEGPKRREAQWSPGKRWARISATTHEMRLLPFSQRAD